MWAARACSVRDGDTTKIGKNARMANEPVTDWTTDYDILDPEYVANPFPVWDDLRNECPVAHSTRWGGSWMPTRYEDVVAVAHDPAHFSSRDVGVLTFSPEDRPPNAIELPLPPIDADEPLHNWTRRLLLPWFSHTRVAEFEPMTRELCNRLIDGFIADGRADAASDYAQQIPVRVIAVTLGVPGDMADTFTGWVRDVLEFAHDEVRSKRGFDGIVGFLLQQVADRRDDPHDDLISSLLNTEVEGEAIPDHIIMGMAALTLIAGVDTTWSAIGSSMWHLATHPGDVRRLIDDPELMPMAVEELLRAYSPVTMARIAVDDTELKGCPVKAGDKVLLSFAAANRDPEMFDRPHEVIFDRGQNRHVAFGAGIHRCAGSNLARMELRVAIEEWLRRIPEFCLADDGEVTWAGGQVRGPRTVPVAF
jgi:cytochrome P450